MTRSVVVAVVLAALAAFSPGPAVAGPPEPGPVGRLCDFTEADDPLSANPDDRVARVDGGPVAGDPFGRLICTLQVNNNLHNGWDTVVVYDDADATGLALVAPVVVGYVSPHDAQTYLCTSWRRANGAMLYWHPTNGNGTVDPTDDEAGHWTTQAMKPCSTAYQMQDHVGRLLYVIDTLFVCPATMLAHDAYFHSVHPDDAYLTYVDHEGDVFADDDGNGDVDPDDLVYDCPLYVEDGDADDGGLIDP